MFANPPIYCFAFYPKLADNFLKLGRDGGSVGGIALLTISHAIVVVMGGGVGWK